MIELLEHCIAQLEGGDHFALATIVESHGSVPRGSGAVMAVHRDGSIFGTVGGGALEANAMESAAKVLAGGGDICIQFDLTNTDAAKSGMICGGRGLMTVMLVTEAHRQVFQEALERTGKGRRGFLVTTWRQDGTEPWGFCYREGGSGQWDGLYPRPDGRMEYLLPLHSGGRLLIFGAGHVSREIAPLCTHLGFQVAVMDDRAEFASEARFPDCTVRVLDQMDCPPAMVLDGDDYVVIATRGHLHDLNCLEWALRTGAGYIGMIGSRRKKGMVLAEMAARGIPTAVLDEVCTPIGLDIQADTPVEIAVSVAAQLIEKRAVRQRGN